MNRIILKALIGLAAIILCGNVQVTPKHVQENQIAIAVNDKVQQNDIELPKPIPSTPASHVPPKHTNIIKQINKQLPKQTQKLVSRSETQPLNLRTFTITAYTVSVQDCGNSLGITASGAKAVVGVTVAAGRNLPFGTIIYIPGLGYRIVQDRGGAIGSNDIDLLVSSGASAIKFGVQQRQITIVKLGSGNPYVKLP
jgi:3D (Asp-Asp-Asp) domain-containing protein